MNPFTRAITYIRSLYEGARYSTRRSFIQSPIQSARFDVSLATQAEILRKSRYFEQNNALMQRLIDLFECYTVGTGLACIPSSSSPEWNDAARRSFEVWSSYPDLVSRQPWGVLQSLIARSWFVDGEVFILKTRGDTGRPRLQLIESHLVRTPPSEKDNPNCIDGVQVDERGRPVGYWISRETRNGQYEFDSMPVMADLVIHVFEPCRPGQMRGLPMIYSVINDLNDLDDLQILEMAAAKEAGQTTKVIKTASGSMTKAELGRMRWTDGTTTTAGASASESKVSYYQSAVPGRNVIMQKGDEMSLVESNRPTVSQREYWRYLMEKICSGVGIPYVLAFPESVQGTVYRGALEMASNWFRSRSAVLQAAVSEVYRYVLGFEKNTSLKGIKSPPDWDQCRIHSPRSCNVDVGRNSQAMLAELSAGATTYDQVYGPLGLDWKEQIRAKAEQARFIREAAADAGVDVSEISSLQSDHSQSSADATPGQA